MKCIFIASMFHPPDRRLSVAYHPLNLALRFILELTMLWAIGRWGYSTTSGSLRWVAAIALVLLAATVWGLFNVPGDPSRSGAAPIAVSGWLRLTLELLLFTLATSALVSMEMTTAGMILGTATTFHYAISWERIVWLLER